MAKGDDILERLLDLAARAAELSAGLGKNPAATHIANQLIRSSTSPAANYAEARVGESKKDFIHKLAIVLKELNECLVWLHLLKRLRLVAENSVNPVIAECSELCRIIAASIKTASGKKPND